MAMDSTWIGLGRSFHQERIFNLNIGGGGGGIIWSPADFVPLLTDKEMISLW